jgi:hypothetical protein
VAKKHYMHVGSLTGILSSGELTGVPALGGAYSPMHSARPDGHAPRSHRPTWRGSDLISGVALGAKTFESCCDQFSLFAYYAGLEGQVLSLHVLRGAQSFRPCAVRKQVSPSLRDKLSRDMTETSGQTLLVGTSIA